MERIRRDREQRRSHRYRPNWMITAGILLLSLGLLMIVWGVTSMQDAIEISKNPLLITGMVFFGIGFATVFSVSLYQQIHQTSQNSSSLSSSPPVYDFQVQVEDLPPHYSECFVIETPQAGEPSPPYDMKTMNDLPSYQDIVGAKKEGT